MAEEPKYRTYQGNYMTIGGHVVAKRWTLRIPIEERGDPVEAEKDERRLMDEFAPLREAANRSMDG